MVNDYWSHWYFISVIVTKIKKIVIITYHDNGTATQTRPPVLHICCQQNERRSLGQNRVHLPWIRGFFLSEYIWNFSVLAFSWLFAILESGLAFYCCVHFLVTSHTQSSFPVTCSCWRYEAPIDCWFIMCKSYTWMKFVTCHTPGSLQGTCSTCWRGRELQSICTLSPSSCCGPANLYSCLSSNHHSMQS